MDNQEGSTAPTAPLASAELASPLTVLVNRTPTMISTVAGTTDPRVVQPTIATPRSRRGRYREESALRLVQLIPVLAATMPTPPTTASHDPGRAANTADQCVLMTSQGSTPNVSKPKIHVT